MPPPSNHKWISLFLHQVQQNLAKINWNCKEIDNLIKEERRVLKELEEAPNIIWKGSDKGGNIVPLHNEMEVMHQLSDRSTYRRLTLNPFPAIVD